MRICIIHLLSWGIEQPLSLTSAQWQSTRALLVNTKAQTWQFDVEDPGSPIHRACLAQFNSLLRAWVPVRTHSQTLIAIEYIHCKSDSSRIQRGGECRHARRRAS